MKAIDFIYKNIYTAALAKGVKDGIASDYAARGIALYKQGRYNTKPRTVIFDMVKEAVRQGKIVGLTK